MINDNNLKRDVHNEYNLENMIERGASQYSSQLEDYSQYSCKKEEEDINPFIQ